jgi:hypothetical protein
MSSNTTHEIDITTVSASKINSVDFDYNNINED